MQLHLSFVSRYLADSNRRTRFCRPLPSHSAKVPLVCECKGRLCFLNNQIIERIFTHKYTFFLFPSILLAIF